MFVRDQLNVPVVKHSIVLLEGATLCPRNTTLMNILLRSVNSSLVSNKPI